MQWFSGAQCRLAGSSGPKGRRRLSRRGGEYWTCSCAHTEVKPWPRPPSSPVNISSFWYAARERRRVLSAEAGR
jgi:hypothetical protein